MDTFVNGTDILLYIDEVTAITAYGPDVAVPGTFDLVACLKDNGFSGNTDQIDTSSKCSGMFKTSLPGQIGWTFSATGNCINLGGTGLNNPSFSGSTDRISNIRLMKLWKAGTRFWAGQFDSSLNTVQYGVCYISSFELSNPENAAANFSITLQGTGEVWDQTATT